MPECNDTWVLSRRLLLPIALCQMKFFGTYRKWIFGRYNVTIQDLITNCLAYTCALKNAITSTVTQLNIETGGTIMGANDFAEICYLLMYIIFYQGTSMLFSVQPDLVWSYPRFTPEDTGDCVVLCGFLVANKLGGCMFVNERIILNFLDDFSTFSQFLCEFFFCFV